jgi:hypothetical protein
MELMNLVWWALAFSIVMLVSACVSLAYVCRGARQSRAIADEMRGYADRAEAAANAIEARLADR